MPHTVMLSKPLPARKPGDIEDADARNGRKELLVSLAIVGLTAIDLIVARAPRLPTWPRHSEFTSSNLVLLPDAPLVTLGGNGANAAYVAARGGAQVTLHTRIGRDPFGGLVRRWLEDAGCRIASSSPASRTSVNITAANVRHERATFFYPGAAPLLPKTSALRGTTHLLVCGWPHPPAKATAALFRKLRRQRKRVFTALDAGPFLGTPWTVTSLAPLLPHLDLFLANEHELEAMTRASGAAAVRALRAAFEGHLVVKRGARGAIWYAPGSNQGVSIAAPRIRAVNTVGAGDSFNGALLAALACGETFAASLTRAVRTAARVVGSGAGVVGLK